jgi:hypothetical protein
MPLAGVHFHVEWEGTILEAVMGVSIVVYHEVESLHYYDLLLALFFLLLLLCCIYVC